MANDEKFVAAEPVAMVAVVVVVAESSGTVESAHVGRRTVE